MIPRHLALALVLTATTATAQESFAQPAETRYAGLTLTEALLDLEARGLEILFTSLVVRPAMRVESEPAGGSLRQTLDQLLAPHGLQARAGPGGKLVVVSGRPPAVAPRSSGIRGAVRERGNGRPLADIQILIQGAEIETLTDAAGSFELPDVPPGIHSLVARRPGFVVKQLSPVTVTAGHVTELLFELVPAPVPLDEIIVTPSMISLLSSEPAARIALGRDEIVALPHLGDDLFRALTLLPGTAGNEFSAQFNVRGGRTDEVLVMLDQLELFDPYHIKDFGSSLSFIAPQAIAEVDLILGGFPAPFGDRMGGVLDMRTVEPAAGYGHLGLSIVTAQAGGAGRLDEDRGDWLAVARYGSLELAKEFVSAEVQPRYWDVFGKVEVPIGAKQRLGMRLLSADDRLSTDVTENLDREQVETSYSSSYLWLTHRAFPSSKLFFDSVLSRGQIGRDRRAIETVEGETEFAVDDGRELGVTGFKQDWNLQPSERHYLRWGFDLRRLDADYDYSNAVKPDDSLDPLRGEPLSDVDFRQDFRGEQYGVYFSERMKLFGKLTAELGLRYDEHTVPGDRDLSPRVNLVAPLGEASSLRLAWGHYFQSQRLYELQVEDGETGFFQSERTEQFGVGIEHLFEQGSTLRLDLYHRDVTNPRPRYENLYEPVDSFPEVQPDRVRIAGDRATARGAEIFLRGPRGGRLEWWVNYAYARVEDEIDGRDVPRGFDQPHTLNADVNYRINDHWSINLAWRYHTGWPTTAVMATLEEEDDEGEVEPVLTFGPINDERLSDYHRLDLRASRRWSLKKGELAFFIDVQNLYDRENIAGFDVEFDVVEGADGEVRVVAVEEIWAGLLPSFGIDWKF